MPLQRTCRHPVEVGKTGALGAAIPIAIFIGRQKLLAGDRTLSADRRGRIGNLCVWYQRYDGGNALFF